MQSLPLTWAHTFEFKRHRRLAAHATQEHRDDSRSRCHQPPIDPSQITSSALAPPQRPPSAVAPPDAERDVAAERSGVRTYLVVGLVAAGIGVGAVFGANQLGFVGADRLTPAQIAEIRAAQFAEQAESVYRAQLAEIYEQRAEEMVELYSRQHQSWVDWIQVQRAQDMVTFQRGWQEE